MSDPTMDCPPLTTRFALIPFEGLHHPVHPLHHRDFIFRDFGGTQRQGRNTHMEACLAIASLAAAASPCCYGVDMRGVNPCSRIRWKSICVSVGEIARSDSGSDRMPSA